MKFLLLPSWIKRIYQQQIFDKFHDKFFSTNDRSSSKNHHTAKSTAKVFSKSPSKSVDPPWHGANRSDRFNAKCRRVLHAAIMVEIYVANISRATLSLPSLPPYMKRPRTRNRWLLARIWPLLDISNCTIKKYETRNVFSSSPEK